MPLPTIRSVTCIRNECEMCRSKRDGKIPRRFPGSPHSERWPVTQVLISFCNVVGNGPMLGLLDTHRRTFRPVAVPPEVSKHRGMTGLAVSDRYIYAGIQWRRRGDDTTSRLLILDRHTLSRVALHTFHSVQRVHSLLVAGEALYAVSTGTDEVIRCDLAHGLPGCEVVVWKPAANAPRDDTQHLNAITAFEGALYISGFGPRQDQLWSSARNGGYVVNLATGAPVATGLNHPHSLTQIDGELAFCESNAGAIRIVGGVVIAHDLPGYARGLCQVGSLLLVGTGIRRRISESTGTPVMSPVDPDDGRCTVTAVALGKGEIQFIVDLTAYGREIYDLLPLDDLAI